MEIAAGRMSRDHSDGDPIEIDYGLRASHRLLRLYGFLPKRRVAEQAGRAPDGDRGDDDGDDDDDVDDAPMPSDEVLVPLLPSPRELANASGPGET